MKVIYNNIIPFEEFKCINLFGVLFVRKGCFMSEEDLNHEGIHSVQILEMFFLGLIILLPFVLLGMINPLWLFASLGTFYYWYFVEWIIRLFNKGNAYRNLGFEKEAYSNDDNLNYLATRPRFAWWKYI